MSKLKRRTELRPGHVRVGDTHGAELSLLLTGPEGAIDLVVYTGWLPTFSLIGEASTITQPFGAYVQTHWHSPLWSGHKRTPKHSCTLFGRCYWDHGGLIANPIFRALVTAGSDAAWQALEALYRETIARSATAAA